MLRLRQAKKRLAHGLWCWWLRENIQIVDEYETRRCWRVATGRPWRWILLLILIQKHDAVLLLQRVHDVLTGQAEADVAAIGV